MSTVDRYIRNYIRTRRVLSASNAIAWMIDFFLLWLLLKARHPSLASCLAALPAIGFFVLALFHLFRPISQVTAAIAIERRRPAFDQRLITAASLTESSPLANQLLEETHAIIAQKPQGLLFPIWPILVPLLLATLLMLLRIHIH